jgi:D-tyrosyl-tRNA(Tyr) deacylase
MKVVLQRVKSASVSVEEKKVSEIDKGYVLMLGIAKADEAKDIEFLINKIIDLRLFENSDEKFDKDLKEVDGEVLVISQFTLFADMSKGRRPYFGEAEKPKKAKEIYGEFVEKFKEIYEEEKVKSGVFGAKMLVEISNDGPVTIILDSNENK